MNIFRTHFKAVLSRSTVLLALLVVVSSSCHQDTPKENIEAKADKTNIEAEYFCPMHPHVRSEDSEATCPICGMNLVPLEDEDSMQHDQTEKEEDQQLTRFQLKPEKGFRPKVKSVERRNVIQKISAPAKLKIPNASSKQVAARFSGRVESLLVDHVGAKVEKHQPLMDVYSPELIETQQEYISAHRGRRDPHARSIRDRLLLWGITESQIKKLHTKQRPPNVTAFTSPSNGIIVDMAAEDGAYFEEGDLLYRVADLSKLWVDMHVYEYQIPKLKVGQSIEIKTPSLGNIKRKSKITFIDQTVNPRNHTVLVRAVIDNEDHQLKPHMIAHASIRLSAKEVLAVPRSALIHTGEQYVVYVDNNDGFYHSKRVERGLQGEHFVEIKNGLNEGDQVVVDGNFLMEFHSQLVGGQDSLYGHTLELDSDDEAKQEAKEPSHDQHHH